MTLIDMQEVAPKQRQVAAEFVVPPSGSPGAGRATSVLFGVTLALGFVWLVGQIARDVTWITGLCFYIPSPIVAGALVGWALINVIRRRLFTAACAALLALMPLGVVLLAENHFTQASASPGSGSQFRLVHWNVESELSSAAQEV